MRGSAWVVCICCLGSLFAATTAKRPVKRRFSTYDYYHLEHDPTTGVSVESCAHALGAEVVEQVGELSNHWVLQVQKTSDGFAEDRVTGTFKRLRRDMSNFQRRSYESRSLVRAIKHLKRQEPRQRVKRVAPSERAPPPPAGDTLARGIAQRFRIADPLFPKQWHLVNEEFPEHMVNATPVWEMGITGEGVISALVDDGLDYESDDLAENFDAAGSHDYNDHVDLPKPILFDDHHGTRCAGQIAAVKNGVCGLGIAYKSKVAGIRILSGPIVDVDEAASLNFGYQNTSIYSCSWGPSDDGRSMEAPDYIIRKAILNGVQNGRGGKGSVFVFASGNGAYYGDQCNFDGYTNSIYSVTVGAIDYKGQIPYYSEGCAANMVVTYSSGDNIRKAIVTTDVGKDKCNDSHGGTSAAAPNAAGIFALALSARPDLTWRDIQHLCVRTAKVVNPGDEDWQLMASGRPYSYKYGFGKLDAYAFVSAAQQWQTVKPQAWVELPEIQVADGKMDENGTMAGGETITSSGVESSVQITQIMLGSNNFESLEHITVRVWIRHTRRGDVEVELISPNGVHSALAWKRKKDGSDEGFPGWKFMTVKHWDESPIGNWTLRVSDEDDENEEGSFLGWQMTLWGSSVDASKSTPYVLRNAEDDPFPPPPPPPEPVEEPEPTTTEASTTKSYMRPTVIHSATLGDTAPTQAQGAYIDDSHERTQLILSIVGFVTFFLLLGGLVFLVVRRKRILRRQGAYASVPVTEDLRLGSLDVTRQQPTHVLYDEDEETGLIAAHEHAESSEDVPSSSRAEDMHQDGNVPVDRYTDNETSSRQ